MVQATMTGDTTMQHAVLRRRDILLAASALPFAAGAQTGFPARNMEMVVPWGPGGGADVLGRMIARWIESDMKASIVVSNAPGAGGTIGLSKLVTAPADGHMLGVLTSDTTMMASLQPTGLKMGDLQALAVMVRQPSGLFTRSESRFKNWAEVVAEAKAKPGTLSVGTTGANSPDDMTVNYLGTKGIRMIAAGYSRPGERYTAVLGGHTDLLYEQAGDIRGHIEGQKMRPLLFFAAKRLPAPFADVPVSGEFGFDPLPSQARSIVVRAGTDARSLAALNASIERFAATTEYTNYLRDQLALPDSFVPGSKAAAFLTEEIEGFKRTAALVPPAEKKS
jgi:tripartite-type tricarboxylate transporter receptor subunit TctC